MTAVFPLLKAVNDAILPVPVEAKPKDGSGLDHENVVPLTNPLKLIGVVDALLQTT